MSESERNKIESKVREFYENYPYPNLPIRKKSDLLNKTHANVMQNILNTIPLNVRELKGKRVLDAGCGTGEKACFFALHGANAVGFDASNASLEIAKKNAKKLKLKVKFLNANIFFLPKNIGKFDHIFCLGVLHHTQDPRRAFEILVKLLKPNGTITIGLYSKYGRATHRIHRKLLRIQHGASPHKILEGVSREIYKRGFRSDHELAFVADKFANPHESYHTLEEVKSWFDNAGLEMLETYPKTKRHPIISQIGWLLEKKGFFIVSGKSLIP